MWEPRLLDSECGCASGHHVHHVAVASLGDVEAPESLYVDPQPQRQWLQSAICLHIDANIIACYQHNKKLFKNTACAQ